MDPLRLANTALAIDIFKKLSEQHKSDNVIFSPLCLSSSLALAYKGAKCDTATQMEKVLHFEKVKEVDIGFQAIASDISKISSLYSMNLMKRVYVDKTLNLLTDFVNSSKKPYPSELETVDFKSQPEETRQQINNSVKELTDGKIENMLEKGSVSEQTNILLLNAASFSGKWMTKFSESETKEAPFRISKTESKPVQMMNVEARLCLGYINELQTMVLEIPYCGKNMSLIILLPKDIMDDSTGLEQLEKELSLEKYVHWTNPSVMASTIVKASIPKFELKESYDLKPTLISLGMSNAFNEEVADFSGMSESKGIALSSVLHKACIEVKEDGAMEAECTRSRILMHKDEFTANHPFIYMLRHNTTRNIIMCGKFCSP
ncbi:serpin B5 [Rhinatrema bivittatum]|uniref:serpin B5 n=1 Tax=Rhinatrema bivittatum TaxID=194408 RepID=UPI001129C9E2|nr:serpin B5 [Rhinatrema bivittatum]XP_029446173.1 serpin B5 [Rhinatrema bivittatum]